VTFLDKLSSNLASRQVIDVNWKSLQPVYFRFLLLLAMLGNASFKFRTQFRVLRYCVRACHSVVTVTEGAAIYFLVLTAARI
jgi:hypothetical protein